MNKTFKTVFAAGCAGAVLALIGPGAAQADPAPQGIQLRLSGALQGQYQVPDPQWARVQTDPSRALATVGLFTDPPSSSLPFDVSMVLGDFRGAALTPGRYSVLPLKQDMPAAAPTGKHGFMVIVPSGQTPPRTEYVTRSGEFIVDAVDADQISGRFVLQLSTPDGSRALQAEGVFRRRLD